MVLAVLREALRGEVATVQAAEAAPEWLPNPCWASTLEKLTRVYSYVLWFLACLKKTPGCLKRPMLERPPMSPRERVAVSHLRWVPASLPWECLEAA
jgi:hypothetical protein